MIDDGELDEHIRRMACEIDTPPAPPRDALWERIVAERARRKRVRHPAVSWPWLGAVAAMLVAAVMVGRYAVRNDAPVAATSAPPTVSSAIAANAPVRMAAAGHLDRVETFLTVFRDEARAGRVDSATLGTARRLLLDTRLLQDSPATRDAKLRTVLDDVEFTLTQIAHYRRGDRQEDLRFIEQGIQQRGVMLKLQAAGIAGARESARGAL
jgi:hypothetical protein